MFIKLTIFIYANLLDIEVDAVGAIVNGDAKEQLMLALLENGKTSIQLLDMKTLVPLV